MAEQRTFDVLFEQDDKSLEFRTLVAAPQKTNLVSKMWPCGLYLNQGTEGACVGHGYAHEAAAEPQPRKVDSTIAFALYREAQKLDQWEGEAYEGTSVLAGAKAYVARKYATEYRWCLSMEDLLATIAHLGPVVIGVNWYEGMFNTDSSGFVHVRGSVAGRHCVLVRGQNLVFLNPRGPKTLRNLDHRRSFLLIHNSWGPRWGMQGLCRISIMGMQRLMKEGGDFCIINNRISEPTVAA